MSEDRCMCSSLRITDNGTWPVRGAGREQRLQREESGRACPNCETAAAR